MDDARKTYLEAERAKWLTPREAAFVLRVSVAHVRRLLREGRLPYRSGGRQRRIHVDALNSFTHQEVRHGLDADAGKPAPTLSLPIPRPYASQTARRLRAFDGGRPRRATTGA